MHTKKKSTDSFTITFIFISPLSKCGPVTSNSRPKIVVIKPSRPLTIGSYRRRYSGSASSPLMYQASATGGFDRPDVQFTWTKSPIWYRGLPPVILGPSSGSAAKMKTFLCYQKTKFNLIIIIIINNMKLYIMEWLVCM